LLFASLSRAERSHHPQRAAAAPARFQVGAYGHWCFQNPNILSGYWQHPDRGGRRVGLNILLTTLGGYFLSRKGVPLRNFFMFFVVFTMFFSGGLVPFYLTVARLRHRQLAAQP